jgi:hypothetical protein
MLTIRRTILSDYVICIEGTARHVKHCNYLFEDFFISHPPPWPNAGS